MRRIPVPTSKNLKGVWGLTPQNVWVVGDNATVLLWDGASWTTEQVPTLEDLVSVWGSDPDNVWATGTSSLIYGGVILHRSKGTWVQEQLPVAGGFQDVWGTSAADV